MFPKMALHKIISLKFLGTLDQVQFSRTVYNLLNLCSDVGGF